MKAIQRCLMRFCAFACVAVLAVPWGRAQEERAAVTGAITDPSGLGVADAVVVIDNGATGFHRAVRTNDAGLFLLPGLLVGVYDLHVSKAGFATMDFKAFELTTGQTRTFNAQMQIAANAEEVQVIAETPALDQSSSKISGVIL